MKLSLQFFAGDPPSDYPDLNKCPDCETYFAQLTCPLCGKECPPEMRAGKRAVNKKPLRDPYHRGSGRVSFTPWYFSTPFIIIMLFVQPLIGMVLLWLGNWQRKWKIAVTAGVIFLFCLPVLAGLGLFFLGLGQGESPPVELSFSREEYIAAAKRSIPRPFTVIRGDVRGTSSPLTRRSSASTTRQRTTADMSASIRHALPWARATP